MTNLRIGIPSKGRLSELAGELLKEAGLNYRRPDRSLFARCRDMPIDVTFLAHRGYPGSLREGAIDMGHHRQRPGGRASGRRLGKAALDVGHCRLAICVPENGEVRKPQDLAKRRIATSFPNTTQQFLATHHTEAHLVHLSGSVEVMIALGVADAIVDLVETGSTLAANRADDSGRRSAHTRPC